MQVVFNQPDSQLKWIGAFEKHILCADVAHACQHFKIRQIWTKKKCHNRMRHLISPWVIGSQIQSPNLVIVSFSPSKWTLCKCCEGAALCVDLFQQIYAWVNEVSAWIIQPQKWAAFHGKAALGFFPASKVASSALVRKWHHCLWLYSRWREGAAPPWVKPVSHMMELKQCVNLTQSCLRSPCIACRIVTRAPHFPWQLSLL